MRALNANRGTLIERGVILFLFERFGHVTRYMKPYTRSSSTGHKAKSEHFHVEAAVSKYHGHIFYPLVLSLSSLLSSPRRNARLSFFVTIIERGSLRVLVATFIHALAKGKTRGANSARTNHFHRNRSLKLRSARFAAFHCLNYRGRLRKSPV